MGKVSGISKKLNKSFKQFTALLLVLSLTIPQNLFANNAADGEDKSPLPAERLDFNKALSSEDLARIGVEHGSLQTMNTTGSLKGMKVDLDVIRGEFKGEDSSKLIRVLKQLEPEIRQAYALDPATKFQFIYIADEREKEVRFEALEIINFLESINNQTEVTTEKVKFSTAEKLRNVFTSMFDKTSKSDIYWSLARLAGGGTSATLSFYLGSDMPLPVSLFLGYGVLGAGSAGIGLFIEKFTGWLEHNAPTPRKGARNYLGSVETYMLLSPALIGLQNNGLMSVEGAALLAGTAGVAAIVQTVYYTIKKRFPTAAMWYKWYATEALFLTVPYLIMPSWDIYTSNIFLTIQSTFLTALFSTMSQGVWDVLLTKKIRAPVLQKAIAQDVSELSQRLSGRSLNDILNMSHTELNKIVHQEEFKVRERFKKWFFLASIVSVTSAVATNTGVYMGIDALKVGGMAGLALLGVSGLGTWSYLNNKLGLFVTVFSAASASAYTYGQYSANDFITQAGLSGLALSATSALAWFYVKYKDFRKGQAERKQALVGNDIGERFEKALEAARRSPLGTANLNNVNFSAAHNTSNLCVSLFK